MKKVFSLLLICVLLCMLSGCENPNSLRLDLSQGFGQEIKLLHLNASTNEKRERMEALAQALADCRPLDKDLSMFAYYPDYRLELSGKALVSEGTDAEGDAPGFTVTDAPGEDVSLTAVVDINGEFVDFYFPGPAPEASGVIYRSSMTAKEFKRLVNHA